MVKKLEALITNNKASKNGGGIYMNNGQATIAGGEIDNNSASGSGGGIYQNLGLLTLNPEKLFNNTAGYNGGGMYIAEGNVKITGGSYLYNQADSGGGIYNNAGNLTIQGGAFITNNNALHQGGGLYLATASTTKFTSCLVDSNTAQSEQGDGVYWQGNANVDTKGLTDDDDPGGIPFKGP